MADPRPRTLSSKALEALRAVELEQRYTKDELLVRYLSLAPYGGNLRGAEIAARRWFGAEPAELSLAEAALLAGLPQSPERLRPDRHPERARARRDHVLDRMRACGFVGEDAWRAARAEPVRLDVTPRAASAPLFAQLALARRPAGGTTTLSLALQRACERLARAHAAELPPGTDVALAVVDVEQGALVALVGTLDPADPVDGQVNAATARRSPGSALKPFVYAAAFEARRLRPDSWVEDAPFEAGGWRPSNFDHRSAGRVRASEALRRSLNLPALRLVQELGPARCAGVMEACGLALPPASAARAGLTLATGGIEVRPIELANAYATLARGGAARPLRLFADEPAPATRALSAETCALLANILSSEPAPPLGWDRARARAEVSWKTGTSSGHRDAWAVGWTARHVVAVWVGRKSGAGDAALTGRAAAEPLMSAVLLELEAGLAPAASGG